MEGGGEGKRKERKVRNACQSTQAALLLTGLVHAPMMRWALRHTRLLLPPLWLPRLSNSSSSSFTRTYIEFTLHRCRSSTQCNGGILIIPLCSSNVSCPLPCPLLSQPPPSPPSPSPGPYINVVLQNVQPLPGPSLAQLLGLVADGRHGHVDGGLHGEARSCGVVEERRGREGGRSRVRLKKKRDKAHFLLPLE